MRPIIRGLPITAAVTLLASCGGSTSTTPVSVVQSYAGALASGDGSTACSLLTGEFKQRVLRSAAVLALIEHRAATLSCAEELRAVSQTLGADQVADLRKAKIGLVSHTGGHATVRMTLANGHVTDVTVDNTAAGWLVAGTSGNSLGTGEATKTAQTPGEPQREPLAAYEQQLAGGQIMSVKILKRYRGLLVTLKNGQRVFAKYGAGQFPTVYARLNLASVPSTILSWEEAEREAGSLAAN